ncbi:hypothetical protein ACJJTC_001666 [Scirpophaga incertulas]
MSSYCEKIDLLEAYFVNNRNAGAALVWYRNKYPLRYVPTRKVITNLLKNLELQDSFKRKRQPRVDMDTEIAVLTYVEAYPEVSSRQVALEVGVSYKIILTDRSCTEHQNVGFQFPRLGHRSLYRRNGALMKSTQSGLTAQQRDCCLEPV